MTKDSISWIIVNNSLKLTTKNLIRGNKFYNEKIIFSNDQEYRVRKPYKSKLAAAILNGLEILPIIEKSRVLYLGTSEVITLSHISDMGRISMPLRIAAASLLLYGVQTLYSWSLEKTIFSL